jgi:hypothetical protein
MGLAMGEDRPVRQRPARDTSPSYRTSNCRIGAAFRLTRRDVRRAYGPQSAASFAGSKAASSALAIE